MKHIISKYKIKLVKEERARKRIRELGEFNDEVLTEDEELVSDIDKSLERVSELYDLTS